MELGGRQAAAAVADGPLLVSGRRLGDRYRLERPLGHGGMASVWLATDERLDRPVAIKVLSDTLAHDDEYLDRFRREAHVAAGLQHPNLVSIYDFEADDERLPGDGVHLRRGPGRAGRGRRRPRRGAARARAPLGASPHPRRGGAASRHQAPERAHRPGGHARLTDFGIAQPRDATALTKTGQVIGTESYLAPEVKEGAPASERADLYALGVVLADVSREGAAASLWELTDRLRDPDPERRPGPPRAPSRRWSAGRRAGPTTATQPFAVTPEQDTGASGAPPQRPFAVPDRGPGARQAAHDDRVIAVGLLLVALIIGLVLGSGGDDSSPPVDVRERGDGAQSQSSGDGGQSATAPPSPRTRRTARRTPAARPRSRTIPVGACGDGQALNDEGFALNQEWSLRGGRPGARGRGGCARGRRRDALQLRALQPRRGLSAAGRPEDAIPVLEQRMQFDDGQLGEVQATLDEAYAAAGEAPPTPRRRKRRRTRSRAMARRQGEGASRRRSRRSRTRPARGGPRPGRQSTKISAAQMSGPPVGNMEERGVDRPSTVGCSNASTSSNSSTRSSPAWAGPGPGWR